MWNIRKTHLIDTERIFVVARVGDWGVGKMSKGSQKVQTSKKKGKER